MGRVTQIVAQLADKRSDEKVLNWWTLRFVDKDLEALFKSNTYKGISRKRYILLIPFPLLVSFLSCINEWFE